MLNYILFVGLPYAAIAVFLVGSIYRYRKSGFQVSSLSTQFLEGRTLFWGTQPFHWGMVALFFGHLIAFMFPKSVILWNGQPLRLLLLEITGFSFGILALIGLFLLFVRRIGVMRVRIVTNYMDYVVYLVLFVQVISGLGVAFFVRWGSSWFAGTLTPYLRSIFAFNPQIDAVGAMPWLVQLHIASAFVIIGIIPFTRFVHFLVVPVDYLWRKYQLVIWNWDRKTIRNNDNHLNGKASRNH